MRLSPFAPIDRWRAPAPPESRIGWLRGRMFAHRGLHGGGLPENSPAAFRAAIARDLGIECDVQGTADGQAVVFHDWELDRLTCERGPVLDRTSAELGTIALAGTDEPVPSLRQVLALVAGRVPLLIEIKSRRAMRVAGLCLAVRNALEGYGGPHAVMSFDPRVPRWFATHAPRTARGLVMTEDDAHTAAARIRCHFALWHARPDFLAYDVRDLPSSFAGQQRSRGVPVATWTVRTAQQRAIAALHADAPIAEGAGTVGPA